jgi:hypothetical protein
MPLPIGSMGTLSNLLPCFARRSGYEMTMKEVGSIEVQVPDDDLSDEESRWQQREALDRLLKPRLARVERRYAQALTGLWIGNAGAALATLSFIGAAWKEGTYARPLLVDRI